MNNNKYLITIVIPVFNARKHIEQFLAHISKQTFRNYEILFLDSNSVDGTTEMIKAKKKAEDRINLIIEKDKGIYDAMNHGVELAQGDWIYFMGCDDQFFDEKVLQQVSSHLRNEYDLVYGDVLWVPDNQLEKGECFPNTLFSRNINHQRIFYRRELFYKYGFYDIQYKVASDHELNIRFFCNKEVRKKYIPVTIALYHSGGFSSNKLDEVFWNNWKQIFKKNFLQHLPGKEMYNKLGWYCRYNIEKHNYRKAFTLFFDVLLHTLSPGFVLLTFKQFIKSLRKNAS